MLSETNNMTDIARPVARILWADDEIDMLRPHIIFLEAKGYRVTPVSSGNDALHHVTEGKFRFDMIFLDENMPGLSGLETLERIKDIAPHIPVVLITKTEDEYIMDLAVGSRISDYLIKPVNPNQILLSVKKVLHSDRLIIENDTKRSRNRYISLSDRIDNATTVSEWHEIYRQLVRDSIKLDSSRSDTAAINDTLIEQANDAFFKFVKNNYLSWIKERDNGESSIVMSPDILDYAIMPLIRQELRPVLLLLDNLTLDQWIVAKSLFTESYDIATESLYTAILPTSTQYCRNAILSGLMPEDIALRFPSLWIDETSNEGKNLSEEQLLHDWTTRRRLHGCTFSYHRTTDSVSLRNLAQRLHGNTANSDTFTVIIVNFTDILAHSVSDNPMLRELTPNDSAFRSIFLSWLNHSALRDLLHDFATSRRPVIITTDHGSVKVATPVKISAEANTTSALRYKLGRNISAPDRQVFYMRPSEAGLPAPTIASTFVVAGRRDFMLYPNNFNHYARTFAGTYQHGGISMQEMILPLVTLIPK